MSIYIINLRVRNHHDAIFIGRPSPLGNPYRVGIDGDRQQVIRLYRRWLWDHIRSRDAVYDELIRLAVLYNDSGSLTLSCFCHPLHCHGDVIAAAILWIMKQ
jgi:hypothetical protein